MKSLSLRVPDDVYEQIKERAEQRGTSVSAEARDLIGQGFDAETLESEADDLQARLESREDRIDELEEQLAQRSQVEDKIDVLATRVEDQNEPAPPWPVRWYRFFRGNQADETSA